MELVEKREKTVEVDGITVTISMDRMEDIETVEAMTDFENGDPMARVPLFRRTFGVDEYKRIKKELKGDSEETIFRSTANI